jgi:hypothetical protein
LLCCSIGGAGEKHGSRTSTDKRATASSLSTRRTAAVRHPMQSRSSTPRGRLSTRLRGNGDESRCTNGTQNPVETIAPKCMDVQRADET